MQSKHNATEHSKQTDGPKMVRRRQFPFRKRSLPYETVDAISQETVMRNGIVRFKWQRPFCQNGIDRFKWQRPF